MIEEFVKKMEDGMKKFFKIAYANPNGDIKYICVEKEDVISNKGKFFEVVKGSVEYKISVKQGDYKKGSHGELNTRISTYDVLANKYLRLDSVLSVVVIEKESEEFNETLKMFKESITAKSGIETIKKEIVIVK